MNHARWIFRRRFMHIQIRMWREEYSAQFIESWLLDRKEEIKRGQSCKSAAVAFNGRLMEISYFENFCRPRYSIPSHHAWNSKILLDIPTKSSRNFQRNWYLQHTENNFEAAALLVYALDVAKKSTKPCLVDFLEVSQMSVHNPPAPPKLRCSLCILVCLPIVMLWNLLIPLLFYYTEFKRSICTPHAVTHKWKHITCNRKHIGSKQAVFFTFWESKQSISIIFLSALKLSRILKSQ